MDQIEFDARVSVFERTASQITGRLSISNIPLSQALHTIVRWPQERREGVLIAMPDRTIPWENINELYRQLYSRIERAS